MSKRDLMFLMGTLVRHVENPHQVGVIVDVIEDENTFDYQVYWSNKTTWVLATDLVPIGY